MKASLSVVIVFLRGRTLRVVPVAKLTHAMRYRPGLRVSCEGTFLHGVLPCRAQLAMQ